MTAKKKSRANEVYRSNNKNNEVEGNKNYQSSQLDNVHMHRMKLEPLFLAGVSQTKNCICCVVFVLC
uniref:Uncharacterized protein n=1 Tax=Trichogramma kaykai TaxID=54128 RepID=A0ABD2W907_9HYME